MLRKFILSNMIRVVAFVGVFAVSGAVAWGDDNDQAVVASPAKEALRAALKSVQMRYAALKDGQVITYDVEYKDIKGEVTGYHSTAVMDHGELIVTDSGVGTKKDRNKGKPKSPDHMHQAENEDIQSTTVSDKETVGVTAPLFLDGQDFDIEAARFVEETDTHWVFAFPPAILLNQNIKQGEAEALSDNGHVVDEHEDEEAVEPRKKSIADGLVSHLFVAKTSQSISSLRVFAPEVFKPSMMLKVKKFEVQVDYKEAWSGGPYYSETQTYEMEGDYALFFSLHEGGQRRISNLRLAASAK